MPRPNPSMADTQPVTNLGLRIRVIHRRARFVALLRRLTNLSADDAWRTFRPLPGLDGPWGVPAPRA